MTVRIPVRMKSAGRGMQPKEADIQRAILDWLAAERIYSIRLNTGAMGGSYKGKSWFVRFGKPGMADIAAFPMPKELKKCPHCNGSIAQISRKISFCEDCEYGFNFVAKCVWIEVKGPKGKQSPEQEQFQKEVTENGMTYILARSLDDVITVLT